MRKGVNAKLLGYMDLEENRKIYIQVDGLGYDTLKKALGKKYMPNLNKILKKRSYKMYKVFSDLPSNTPSAQMKIMYGIKNKILGFRWYDKKNQKHHSFKMPETAKLWEEYAEKNTKKKLLENGSSYINLFSGGAKRVVLNLSHAFMVKKDKEVSNINLWKFVLFNLDFIIKIMFKIIKEFLIETYEYVKYKIYKKPQRSQIFFPYVRIINNVFFKEIATMGALLDINERMKKIYITYNGYDEVGHQRSSESIEALRTLKSIDRAIGKLIKNGEKNNYSLYIFSDHGQTRTIPFKNIYKKTLKELIAEKLLEKYEIGEYDSQGENKEAIILYVSKKVFNSIFNRGYKRLSRFLNRICNKSLSKMESETIEKEEEIIVENSGPMAHIYFTKIIGRATKDEVSEKYKNLMDDLLYHTGIEFGIVKTKTGYLLSGRKGNMEFDSIFNLKKKENQPLCDINIDEDLFLKAIKEIVLDEKSGDVIIFGAILGENKVINFEEQYGGHGGIGGRQNYPFLICKEEIEKNTISVSDLYNIFGD